MSPSEAEDSFFAAFFSSLAAAGAAAAAAAGAAEAAAAGAPAPLPMLELREPIDESVSALANKVGQ